MLRSKKGWFWLWLKPSFLPLKVYIFIFSVQAVLEKKNPFS